MTRSAADIFHEARELPADKRAAYLTGACGKDVAQRSKVEALLEADAQAGSFLGSPAADQGAPSQEQAGASIGRYKLLEQIGEGGMGTIWMAEQREPVKRRVALKIIKLGMDTKQVIARFEAERQALAMMDHPNIAKVLDAGATETGRPYFVMEYIRGIPILEYCDQEKVDTEARLLLFTSVCHAIQHAHQKGIIHRDIKPSNVLVTLHDGVPAPKVIDFGIAKATNSELTTKTLFTEHRQMIGTPAYMSPEQAEMSGLDIDTRSDIYSLGVLLYELLTGTTPFDTQELLSKGFAEMLRAIREDEPHKPSTRISSLGETGTRTALQRNVDAKKLSTMLRGDIDWIVMKCLEKDRSRRYETANGLAADIRRHLNDEPVTAGAPSASYKLRKFVRRNRVKVLAAGAVAAALVIGVVAFAWKAEEAREEAAAAEAAWRSEAEQRKLADAARAEAQAQQRKAEEQEAEAKKQELEARAQEAEAKKQAAIAEAVAKFQTEMLAAVDPNQLPKDPVTREPLKDAVTVLQAMQAAIKLLDEGSLKDQPLVEANVRRTIGQTLSALGRSDEAEPILRTSLAIYRATLPAGDVDIASSISHLALALLDLSKLDEAERLLREALEIARAAYPAGHPSIANGLDNLAKLLMVRNESDEAEPLMREALAIRRAAFSADDPEIAKGMQNLALLLQDQNKLAEAEQLYREALEIKRAALPAGHPRIANGLNSLASVLQHQNKLAEAEPLYREALEIWRAALPAGHPLIARGLSNLASLLFEQGKLDQSLPMFEEALESQDAALGRQHSGTLVMIANLGVNYSVVGRLADALPLLEEAYAASKREPSMAWVGAQLLAAYELSIRADGPVDSAKVVRLIQELLASSRAGLSKDSPELAEHCAAFSNTLLALGKWGEADVLLRECLTIREKTQPDDWRTFNTKSMLGAALLGQKKFAEAQPLLLDGYRGLKEREPSIPPQGAMRIFEALERLVQLYEASGDAVEADLWREKLGAQMQGSNK